MYDRMTKKYENELLSDLSVRCPFGLFLDISLGRYLAEDGKGQELTHCTRV